MTDHGSPVPGAAAGILPHHEAHRHELEHDIRADPDCKVLPPHEISTKIASRADSDKSPAMKPAATASGFPTSICFCRKTHTYSPWRRDTIRIQSSVTGRKRPDWALPSHPPRLPTIRPSGKAAFESPGRAREPGPDAPFSRIRIGSSARGGPGRRQEPGPVWHVHIPDPP